MSQLAEHERISRPSVTGIVDRLSEKGLLHREPDEDDARARIVRRPDEGQKLEIHGRRERTAVLARELERLPPDDFSTVRRATEILTEMLDGDA